MDLANIEEQIVDTRVRLCLDCGKCTVVCPVAQYDRDFNPRRIIQRALGSKKVNVKDEDIWACFNCHMCLERCNYNVKFPDFVNALRAEAVNRGMKVQCTHGGALQAVMKLMVQPDIRQRRLEWLTADIKLNPQSDTIFFVGCAPYFDEVFEANGVSTLGGVRGALRVLNLLGVELRLLENERCCGRDLLVQGDRKNFLALARLNLAEFKSQGVKKIITACPECYGCLARDYQQIEPQNGLEIVNLVEVIRPLLKDRRLAMKAINKTVTYQDPCNLGRSLRIFDTPRELLREIPGIVLKEMKQSRENALCCGANPWAYCNSVNRQVQGERLNQARETGAQIMVTACPKCEIHLKCAQKGESSEAAQLEIEDLAQLLSEALGGAADGG